MVVRETIKSQNERVHIAPAFLCRGGYQYDTRFYQIGKNLLAAMKVAIYIRVSTHWQVDKDSLKVQERERTILEDQWRRYNTAMNRLKALYLYSDEDLPEKDFIVERKRILDAIADIDKKLSKFEGEIELNFNEDFTKKASYFIMVDTMLSEKAIDPVEIVRSIEPGVIKSFLNTVLTKIVVSNGHVTEIHFKNGMAHKFIYK